jgi:Uma2 family endonuclease
MFAMAGASYTHNRIITRILVELETRLRGGSCAAVANDQRVRIDPTGLYTYPDVVVVCGEPHFTDSRQDTLSNPAVIIEVLSPSTELYDRNEKFRHYETLESLKDYVLFAQDCVQIDHYARQGQHQRLLTRLTDPKDSLKISSIPVEIPVAVLYGDVDAPTADA